MRREMVRSLCEELADARGSVTRRSSIAWVIGHANEGEALPGLFQVADSEEAPTGLREVAAYAWWRLGLARDGAQSRRASARWPEVVLLPTLAALLDEAMAGPQHQWTRAVMEARPEMWVPAFMLGDYPEEWVPWIFVGVEEMRTLGLSDPALMDVRRLTALGEDWAAHPPSTFFGSRALRDAYKWTEAALRLRVAQMRYQNLRHWEAFLREALTEPPGSELPPPDALPVPLPKNRPQAEATTLLLLGALRASGHENDPVGMSAKLSAAAAGMHITMSQVYENAHKTAWHVAGLTGRLELRLLGSGA